MSDADLPSQQQPQDINPEPLTDSREEPTLLSTSFESFFEPLRFTIFAVVENGINVAISPDGCWAIVGLADNTLQRFDLTTSNPMGQPFAGHTSSVLSVAFSADGQRIVSGSRDQTVRLWNLDGTPIGQPFKGHAAAVWSVAFSLNGQRIVSGSHDQTLQLWNLDGTPIGQPFKGHTDAVLSVTFSPDGKRIVSSSWDKTVRLWNLDGTPIGQPFEGHTDVVWSVAFSPDGQRIVSGSADKTVRLWNLDGTPIGQPFEGHTAAVRAVAFSPDGQRIVSGSWDETVRLWEVNNVKTGQPFVSHRASTTSVISGWGGSSQLAGLRRKHLAPIMSVAFSPDGQRIINGSGDEDEIRVQQWKVNATPIERLFAEHPTAVISVAFSPDGQYIVTASKDNIVQLWDTNGTPIGHLFVGHTDVVWSVAFSPDGQRIVSGSSDNTVRLWNLDGKLIGQPFEGHTDAVLSVTFSPDGQHILSGSGDTTVRLWNLDGTPIGQPFQGHTDAVWSVAFSPDGQRIVSGSMDKTVRLWDTDGSLIGYPFVGHIDTVRAVAFSPDGQRIVSGSLDNTVRLWDTSGTPIGQPFEGHTAGVWSVAFSPDGQRIVSGGGDSKKWLVIFWNPFGELLFDEPDVPLVPDGQRDNTVRLWELNGTPIGQPFEGHTSAVLSVVFSPDGQRIVSGSDDKTVRLWNISRYISVPQGIANDLAQGEDQLRVKDELDALATVLMLRSLQPPVAVGILGNWGSGKSFGMYLIQQKVNEIRSQSLTPAEAWGYASNPSNIQVFSPSVGHVYQIQFNAWTYAKSNLWASLMQEIFYELNRQISLEQQLGHILSTSWPGQLTPSLSKSKQPPQYLNQFIYRPLSNFKKYCLTAARQIAKPGLWLIKMLDLCLFQLFLHISLLVFLLVLFVFLIILALLLELLKLVAKRFFDQKIYLFEKLLNALQPVVDWLNLGAQFERYYFPDLHLSSESRRQKVEAVAERVLFLLFVGFPIRLRDRQKFWARQLAKPDSTKPPESKLPDSLGRPAQDPNLIQTGQALRKGGNVWRVLYLMSEQERRTFLKKELTAEQFEHWKTLAAPAEVSNALWTALDHINQADQERLKETESKLQAKEKALQRQLKSAEVEVSQRLSRRAGTALWKPLINGLVRLRFSKEEVEACQDLEETFQLFRRTIRSWQGLMALFLTGIFIAITVSPDGWSQTVALLQQWLQSSGLANLIASLIPDWLKSIPTEAVAVFEWMRVNLPIGLQIFTGILVAVIPIVKALSEYVASVQKEQARIQSERDSLLQQEQGKAEGLAKEVAQLKLQVEEQRQRLGLTANYSSLLDFVNSRLAGDDYGKHLGLMQQVKQDLAALSERLTEGAHNQEELKKIFPRGPARVILYIDDLDRCPPNRVVEVLEAVQLLLNTKLFIVVLGIDDRYIARALEEVYRGVLKRRGKPSGIDYLEKIIQIPYRMRPISPATVESYLRAQLQIRKPSEQQADPADPADTQSTVQPKPPAPPLDLPQSPKAVEEQPKPTDELANTPPVESSEPHDIAAPVAAPLSVEQTLEQTDRPTSLSDSPTSNFPASNFATSNFPTPPSSNIQQTVENSHDNGQLPSQPEGANVHPSGFMPFRQSDSYSENIAQVTEFDEVEFKILVDCCKQVDITPRTAKRLINIYKILQIIWATRSQQAPSQPPPSEQDKRLVMSFLALSGRYPTFMRNLFEEIDVLLEEKSLDESQDGNPDNPQIAIALKNMLDKINPQLRGTDFHAQREWRRFSSDIQRMLNNPTLKFDRQTFELMLSFCFVGDIGYDPDDYSPNSQPHSHPGQQHPDHNPA